jgi:hypothetical protein
MADEHHSHLIDFPEALATLLSRLGELKVVLGPTASARVDGVEEALRAALAARERADIAGAIERIGVAMDRLAALASDADPAEGAMMRAVAAHFRTALVHGAMGDAQETADVMRERSGSVVTPKKER